MLTLSPVRFAAILTMALVFSLSMYGQESQAQKQSLEG